ncbi:MAG: hypothetical protein JWP27_3047 [Flaviaesturariibacter sp.]|nr:hypothetical protein [Flaviaesturariibacter sp.]
MGTRFNAEFRPVDMPVVRPQQLTIEQAIRSSLNQSTAMNREAVFDPGVNNLTGNAQERTHSRLATEFKECVLERGMAESHVNSVANKLTARKQHVAIPVQKLGMTVWKNIADELHRRNKTNAWFGAQLKETRQVIAGWKKRGVPAKDHERIADLFGWTLDRLVKGPDESAPAEVAPVAAALATPSTIYSPMALDLARQLDEITDLEEKQKAYALMVHIARQSAMPSPVVPSPKVPAPSPSAPGVSPTQDPRRVK